MDYNYNEKPCGCPQCGSGKIILIDDTLKQMEEPDQVKDYTCSECGFSWFKAWKFSHWGESVG